MLSRNHESDFHHSPSRLRSAIKVGRTSPALDKTKESTRMPGNRIKTLKALQSKKSGVTGGKIHPNSRRAKQLQRVQWRTKKLELQAKVQRNTEIKRVDRHIYFVHALPEDKDSVTLSELHQILVDYINRNDMELSELASERESRKWRKGEGKTKRESELELIKESETSEYRSGWVLPDLTLPTNVYLARQWVNPAPTPQNPKPKGGDPSFMGRVRFIRIEMPPTSGSIKRESYGSAPPQPYQQQGEQAPPPRSRNGSVATGTSRESRTSTGGAVPTSHMDSTITRLLVATKQLLEGLAKWSRGEITEDAISAIYVKLGNDFNVACAAFARENIGMSELLSVPSELRVCLESCLSDEPSQATLEKHLPQVRQIIIGLLTGLREKQRLYRDGVSAKRRRGTETGMPGGYRQGQGQTGPPLTPNSASRSREDLRKFVSQAQAVGVPAPTPVASTSQLPPPLPPTNTSGPSPTSPSVPQTTPKIGQPIVIAPRIDSQGMAIVPSYPNKSPGPRNQRRVISEEGASGSGALRGPRAGRASEADAYPLGTGMGMGMGMGTGSSSARSSSSASASSGQGQGQGQGQRVTSGGSFGGEKEKEKEKEKTRPTSPPPPKRVEEVPEPVPTTPITDLYPQAIPTGPPATPPSTTFASPPPPPPPQMTSPLPKSLPLADDMISPRSAPMDTVPVIPYSPPVPPAVPRPPPPSLAPEEPFTPTLDGNQTAAQLESLEALKSSDNLSRRASKRYSAYAIQKITTGNNGGSPARTAEGPFTRDGKGRSGTSPSFSAGRELVAGERKEGGVRRAKSEFRASRGVNVPPPMPAMPTSISEGNLGRIGTISEGAEEEEQERKSPELDTGRETLSPIPTGSTPLAASLSPRSTQHDFPPVPTPDDSIEKKVDPPAVSLTTEEGTESPILDSDAESYPISIYLQIGREVKKGKLDSMPTIAGLRVLFIERFQYNPGHADFPTIYLRDPKVNVQYELEDMTEVKEGSVISLNIDSVEQVKQHIDQGLSGLAQEIKELRSTVSAMRRASVTAAAFSPEPASSPIVARPSEHQFQDTAQKMLKMKRLGSTAEGAEGRSPLSIAPSISSVVESGPVSSTSDPRSMAIVGTLKSQHEEVQNLRRDIGVLRQVYADFAGSTKTMLASVRAQTSHVQTLAATKVSSSRAFIEAGVNKLETETTDLVVKGDDLQDAVDAMRLDISTKKIRPRPGQVSEIAAGLRGVMKARDDLAAWITTVKPSWRTTWSDELERIVGEQKLLEAQENLLKELQDDLRDASGVLETIEEVTKHSKGTTRPPRELSTLTSDAPADLSTVLLEVQALQPDPNRRLEAIARAEKARELELANRKDDFAEELDDFVAGGKLKKSGGIEETERLRQARSEANLRAMFAPPE